MMQTPTTIGSLIRSWRAQRHVSQLALALDAEVSQKHLSFIESGRAMPSRDMVMRLAEYLDVPLRDRNVLLQAAGFAPLFQERPFDDPTLTRARLALEIVLKGHEPNPALVVDRHWQVLAANSAVAPLLVGVDPDLLRSPISVMRISLHPRGLAPMTVNLAEWRRHLLDRLRRQYRVTSDPVIGALLTEVSAYPAPAAKDSLHEPHDEIAVPFKLRRQEGVLSFFSAVTVFGAPMEITLSETSLEAFYPADDATAEILQAWSRDRSR